MIRLCFYITLAILLALGAAWFTDNPGKLILIWQDFEIQLSVAVLFLLILAYTVCLWHLFKLYRWFKTDNPLKAPKRMESRRQKGLAALDLGWSALAVKDKTTALKQGKKAYVLLPDNNDVLRLLYEASPEADQHKYLDILKNNKNSQMLALKWSLDQALSERYIHKALTIIQEMQPLSPNNTWIMMTAFGILTRLGHWQDARNMLDRLFKARAMDRIKHDHLAAVLYYSQAMELDIAGKKPAAHDLMKNALKSDREFIPAALYLSRYYLAQNNKSRAEKIIEDIWKKAPHPELAQAFLKLEPLESGSEKFRRVEKFSRLNGNNIHSLHLLAKIALDTEHWSQAKVALDKLLNTKRATQETYHLLARLELLQKNDKQKADVHIASAKTAPSDPVWQCDNCNNELSHYAAICPQCHHYGQVKWQKQKIL
ncbi:MAG: tetratricopeptide repeat protein [Emcibacter sp.]|nr:tetratricopeptide repeat protein [Emcibacter sp.]